MTPITYLKGDATNPQTEGKKIISHCCNDCIPGKWGAGFVLAISKRWKEPEKQYREWSVSANNYKLGEVQFVGVANNLVVANMIGQHGVGFNNGNPPVRYDAVDSCLAKVAEIATKKHKASIHMPRICCGLAGGTWDKIEPLIIKNLSLVDVPVFVYDIG